MKHWVKVILKLVVDFILEKNALQYKENLSGEQSMESGGVNIEEKIEFRNFNLRKEE